MAADAYGRSYSTSCDVEDGFAVVAVDTDDAAVDFSGSMKIRTYDKWGHAVGKIKANIEASINANSNRSIANEPVDWYVSSCSLDLNGMEIVVERTRYSGPEEVVVHRPAVVIEPKIVFGFPFLPIAHSSNTVVYSSSHTHSSHCGHGVREVEVIQSYGSRPGRVVYGSGYHDDHHRTSVRIENHNGYNPRYVPRPSTSRVITVRHKS
jgi:hypothetical protein